MFNAPNISTGQKAEVDTRGRNKKQTNDLQLSFLWLCFSRQLFLLCRPIGSQAEGAARYREPGWPAREPHGYRGYGFRPCKRQPAQLHRFPGGRSQGNELRDE